MLDEYDQLLPTILEIPSPAHPYNPEKDSVMQRINKMLGVQWERVTLRLKGWRKTPLKTPLKNDNKYCSRKEKAKGKELGEI